jgi:hypothetical protein
MLLVKGEVRLVGGEKRRGRVLCLRKFWAELDWGNGEGWTRSERKEQGGRGEGGKGGRAKIFFGSFLFNESTARYPF